MEKRVQEVTNRTIKNVPYQLKVLDKSIMGSQHFVLRQQLSIFNCQTKTKFLLTSDCIDLMLLVSTKLTTYMSGYLPSFKPLSFA